MDIKRTSASAEMTSSPSLPEDDHPTNFSDHPLFRESLTALRVAQTRFTFGELDHLTTAPLLHHPNGDIRRAVTHCLLDWERAEYDALLDRWSDLAKKRHKICEAMRRNDAQPPAERTTRLDQNNHGFRNDDDDISDEESPTRVGGTSNVSATLATADHLFQTEYRTREHLKVLSTAWRWFSLLLADGRIADFRAAERLLSVCPSTSGGKGAVHE